MQQHGGRRCDQIVAELRQRIAAGELAPGDRVPSTREITRQWGVAMATATKALTQLRREGLVRPVPGVGTVVDVGNSRTPLDQRPAVTDRSLAADRSPEAGPRRTSGGPMLTSERIVAVAIAVADAEGLAAISMRRVASDLGAATMSLYRHVADKDDLVTRMIDAAFAERTPPTDLLTDPSGDWRQRLELAAHTLWAMFHRHPWLAPAMSVTRPQVTASIVPFTEGVLTTLDGRGLDLSTMLTIHLTLFTYVRGTAIEIAMEADAEADSGLDQTAWEEGHQQATRSLMVSGRYPRFAQLIADGYDFDLDRVFDFGLQRLLDGIATILEPRPR